MQVVICIVNTLQFCYRPQTNLRRLCFHRCLSVHSGGGGVCQGDPTPVRYCAAGTHPAGMHSWYRLQTKFAKVMFLRVSVILFTGGGVSQHALQVSRGWYPSMPCRSPGPHPMGKLRGLAWGVSRPTPRGKFRGLAWGVSRPTPRGEVEGSGLGRGSPGPHMRGLQAHTQGKVEGSGLGGSPDPHPGES